MKYSTPDDEEENLGPSKSALKREMTALQKLGVALVALSRDQLKKVDMPERLRDAIHDAQRFTQHDGLWKFKIFGRSTPRPEVITVGDRQDVPTGTSWPRTALPLPMRRAVACCLGIEDEQDQPPSGQLVPADLPDTIRRKIGERTVNVSVLPNVVTAPNGGQYIDCASHGPCRGIHHRRPLFPACGRPKQARYRRRRDAAGQRAFRLPWETQTTLHSPRAEADAAKVATSWSGPARIRPRQAIGQRKVRR
jgi:hypothetical protein